MNTPLHMLCYHCEDECDEMSWCYGCRELVCPSCDQTDCSGRHRPEDHLTDAGHRVLGLLALLRAIEVLSSRVEAWTASTPLDNLDVTLGVRE